MYYNDWCSDNSTSWPSLWQDVCAFSQHHHTSGNRTGPNPPYRPLMTFLLKKWQHALYIRQNCPTIWVVRWCEGDWYLGLPCLWAITIWVVRWCEGDWYLGLPYLWAITIWVVRGCEGDWYLGLSCLWAITIWVVRGCEGDWYLGLPCLCAINKFHCHYMPTSHCKISSQP